MAQVSNWLTPKIFSDFGVSGQNTQQLLNKINQLGKVTNSSGILSLGTVSGVIVHLNNLATQASSGQATLYRAEISDLLGLENTMVQNHIQTIQASGSSIYNRDPQIVIGGNNPPSGNDSNNTPVGSGPPIAIGFNNSVWFLGTPSSGQKAVIGEYDGQTYFEDPSNIVINSLPSGITPNSILMDGPSGLSINMYPGSGPSGTVTITLPGNLQTFHEVGVISGYAGAPTTSNLTEKLIQALLNNNEPDVENAINQGADVQATDPSTHKPLLELAALNGSVDEINDLIRSVPSNQQLSYVNKKDVNGQTALYSAILSGNQSAVQTLLIAGSNPYNKDNAGVTPLDWAEQHGESGLIPYLNQYLSNGNINIHNVQQASENDCWAIAGVEAVAQTPVGSQLIKNTINNNEDGTFKVDFPDNSGTTVTQADVNNLYPSEQAVTPNSDMDMKIILAAVQNKLGPLSAASSQESVSKLFNLLTGRQGSVSGFWPNASSASDSGKTDTQIKKFLNTMASQVNNGKVAMVVDPYISIIDPSAPQIPSNEILSWDTTSKSVDKGHEITITNINSKNNTVSYLNPSDTSATQTVSIDTIASGMSTLHNPISFAWTSLSNS